MKVDIDSAVAQVDVPAIKGRIPRERQDEVLATILEALYEYPLNPSGWRQLNRNLAGYYKVVFASGLNDAEELDMRMALSYDEPTDTVTVVSVGFRDAHVRPDFYQRLQVRLDTAELEGRNCPLSSKRRRKR